MGLVLCGVEFSMGSLSGIEGYVIGRMTKSCRRKLYIDDAGWGPEADSIEYGFRVPFGENQVFIGKVVLEICPRGNNKLVIIIFPCS